MILLIDGYNLLKHIHGPSVSEHQRHVFADTINTYAHCQPVKPWIIYDGGVDARPVRETHGLVTIVYAGWKSTADNYIQEYITYHLHKKELLLISSDRELAVYADNHKIPSINVTLFWHLVQLKIKSKTPKQVSDTHITKLSQEHNPHLDALMYSTDTLLSEKEHISEMTALINDAQKSSKIDTKLLTILKKLL